MEVPSSPYPGREGEEVPNVDPGAGLIRVQIVAPPPASCVTLEKLLGVSALTE